MTNEALAVLTPEAQGLFDNATELKGRAARVRVALEGDATDGAVQLELLHLRSFEPCWTGPFRRGEDTREEALLTAKMIERGAAGICEALECDEPDLLEQIRRYDALMGLVKQVRPIREGELDRQELVR